MNHFLEEKVRGRTANAYTPSDMEPYGNYIMAEKQDEDMLAFYGMVDQLDRNAKLVAYINERDAENTMHAMHLAAALVDVGEHYVKEFPHCEAEFRMYLRDFVIRSSGRIGGGF